MPKTMSLGFSSKRRGTINKGTDKQYVAVFCYIIQLITIKLCTKFQNHSRVVAEISLTEKSSLERKKNKQIKGLVSNMWLFFCNTIQLITTKLCTKFQNPK